MKDEMAESEHIHKATLHTTRIMPNRNKKRQSGVVILTRLPYYYNG